VNPVDGLTYANGGVMADGRYLLNPCPETAGPAFSLDLLPTVLNVDPAQMEERGYLLKEPPEAPEVANLNKPDQAA
jgi:hypothetical protein